MRRTLALAAVAILPLTACSDDDSGDDADASGSASAPAAEGGTLTVVAESVTGFDAESYTAEAGTVHVVYENADGSNPHTLVIDGIDTDEFRLRVGDSDEGDVELEAGEYTIFCDVPGHRGAGMEATLTVE